MLAAIRNRTRFLEMTQVVLAFIGTCTVVDSSLPDPSRARPGYFASVPLPSAAVDRRFNDLARSDRKRREAEQLMSRRGGAREVAVAQRQTEA